MKAYDKQEVDSTFNRWQDDLDQLDVLEVVPLSVLNKIRAEIEQLTSRYTISRERGGIGQVEWSDRLIQESEVIQIIEKYKTETKETQVERED